jgi:alkylation response protein AidB-like acyl-CoA dehydrogenase
VTEADPGAVFAFSPEQEELRATVRRFLADRSPEAEVRRLMETEQGYDRAVWTTMAGQLGLQGLAVPERFGGAGSGFVDLQIVLEEMGRALLCAPFLSTAVLAAQAVLQSGDEAAAERYLPGIADGSTIATLAPADRFGSGTATAGGASSGATATGAGHPAGTTATADGDGHRLTGEKMFVLDGHLADLLLVVVDTGAGPSLFAVDAHADGVHREALPTLDATRKQSRLVFDAAPARLVGQDGGAAAPLARTLDRAAAALAAEQAGGARKVLEMSVEYAKMRHQFGRPIGSFQAIKHKCADMLLDAECATSAAYAAGWAIDAAGESRTSGRRVTHFGSASPALRVGESRTSDEAGVLACLAKAYCSEAYYRCAAENIQIHGGIGFTWEHPAHLYFKRAKSSEILFGTPREHRALLADRLGF